MLDAEAIERAYLEHGHSVLRRARRILGDEQEAREVLQEVFASLIDRPQQFEGRSSILTWLYSATTHRSLNRLRDQRTRLRLVQEHFGGRSEGTAPAQESDIQARQILANAPSELAQVAVYYYYDEMTHAEIAELLSCSRRHVGNLLERFKEHVKKEERVS